MPTYEYLCKNCGQQFEVFQSFSAKPLKKHDVCGGEVQKVFHARGVVFKGSGFYVTDSKSPKTSAKSSGSDSSGKSDSGGKTDSGGKSESGGKSDSGSEGKSDSKPKSDPGSKSKTESSSRSSSTSSRSDD